MCGITGFTFSNFNKSDLEDITDVLTPRGPNAGGYFYSSEPNIGLGHRRLSILDLSETANQPMHSHCNRYVMVFNGEVYNYQELREKLDGNWKTNSDTEVILQAFVSYGNNFVTHLNGMFAIAIWDKKEEQLHLFRDRLGIKPLYYHFDGSSFVFASEIKAITTLDISLTINKKAVSHYFNVGFVPQKETIYNEIKQLDSGCFGVLKKGIFTIEKYWSLENKVAANVVTNFDEAKTTLKGLLEKSVEYRLISDVETGTFLSGGTDSSIVTAIASKLSSKPINTFSIGFKEAKYNESEQAKKIATYLKTNHHEFDVSYTDALSELEKVMDNFDQPFVDSSALPTFLVSKLAKQYATVALSGDGGDELFMGYGSYSWGNRMSNPMVWKSRKLISKLLSTSSKNRNKRAAQVFNAKNKDGLISHIFSQEQYLFSTQELGSLLINSKPFCLNESIETKRLLIMNEQQSLFEINNYLKEDLLVKVDRSSMLNSLEVRVPLLDHNVVEYALNLSPHLKINNGVQKHILKEVLYDYVPKQLLDYPKWGFSIPLDHWLRNELSYLIEKYIDDKLIAEQQIFNLNHIKSLKDRFAKGETYLYNRLWQIIVFNKFYLKSKAVW